MNTNELIKNLGNNLKTSQHRHFFMNTIFAWIFGSGAVLALSFILLPIRPDFSTRNDSLFFRTETMLLFSTFLATSVVTYRSLIPGLLNKRDQAIALSLVLTNLLLLLSRFSLFSLPSELQTELAFSRGLCGPILFAMGAVQGGITIALARRGAPTHLRQTALWLGLSSAALALFTMQFICEHENFVHLMIWHLTPIVFLTTVSLAFRKHTLRW